MEVVAQEVAIMICLLASESVALLSLPSRHDERRFELLRSRYSCVSIVLFILCEHQRSSYQNALADTAEWRDQTPIL
jgi:hypothetical protein